MNGETEAQDFPSSPAAAKLGNNKPSNWSSSDSKGKYIPTHSRQNDKYQLPCPAYENSISVL